MSDRTALVAVGLNHRTAPLELRERVTFSDAEIPCALEGVLALPGVEEAFLLSTCNRTELYVATTKPSAADGVTEFLCAARGVERSALEPALYFHGGSFAARQALRVASGLDSMIVGEPQILGQVRRALDIARSAGATGPMLNRLMQSAIVTGRRVRQETGLAKGAPSVPRAALSLARDALGSVAGRPMMIVGAGKIASLVAEVFTAAGARVIAVANRTPERARPIASRVHARASALDAITSASGEVDLVVVCTASQRPVVTAGMLAPAAGRERPLLVIDLGVPRGVAPEVASLEGVTLRVLDHLAAKGTPVRLPPEQLGLAERIVDESLSRFEDWLAARAAAPLIAQLCARADAIVQAETDRMRGRLQDVGETQRDAMSAAVHAAVRKLLHTPIVRMRDAAARSDLGALDAARELFGLGDPLHRRPEPGCGDLGETEDEATDGEQS